MMLASELMSQYDGDEGGAEEKRRALMAAIADRGELPGHLHQRLGEVRAYWDSRAAGKEFFLEVKLECWVFLEANHGNSASIIDTEHRNCAMLSIVEQCGDQAAGDPD